MRAKRGKVSSLVAGVFICLPKEADFFTLLFWGLGAGAEEVAQLLRECTVLTEGMSLVPSMLFWWFTAANNSSFQPSWAVPLTCTYLHTDIHAYT